MRIITLWQPWASLIALGFKKFETRSWRTRYRGKLAIHAAKRKVDRDELAKISFDSIGHLEFSCLDTIDYPYGQIIAVSELKSCRYMLADENELRQLYCMTKINGRDANSYPLHYLIQQSQKQGNIWLPKVSVLEKSVGLWQSGRYAWQLDQVRQIQPINYRGGQGLRTLDAETSRLLESIVEVSSVRV